jgi:plastocyanin
MPNSYRKLSSIAAFCAVSACAAAAAHTALAANASLYGEAVDAASTRKEIAVNPDTKWVNVTDGETVRFVAGGQSFTWHFATYPNTTNFDLAAIAPQDFPGAGVRVYVASNPLYRD